MFVDGIDPFGIERGVSVDSADRRRRGLVAPRAVLDGPIPDREMEVRGVPLERAMRHELAPLQHGAAHVRAGDVLHRPMAGLTEHEALRRLGDCPPAGTYGQSPGR